MTHYNLMTTGEFTKHLPYDNLKLYLKTKAYDHLLDVLRQLGSNSQKDLLS